MYKPRTGMKVTNIKTKEIDYTKQTEGVERCPRCGRMALVEEGHDHTHYQHIIVKAYGNGTLLNTYPKAECTMLN